MAEKKYIVTITRQFGSLGRPIAREMSEILGIEYYDRDIVEATSKKMNLPVSKISEHEETYSTSLFSMLLPLGSDSIAKQDEIYNVQKEVIREMAEKESCIIVGRCADYALEDNENLLSVFIHADLDARIRRIARIYDLTDAKAKDMIMKTDKKRASYYNYYSNKKWGSAESYHMSLDSSVLGIDGTAEAIEKLVELKERDSNKKL